MTRIDELNDLLYRLNHLKNPSEILRRNIEEEIRKCKDRSAEGQSTSAPARANSTKNPGSPKQLTLA